MKIAAIETFDLTCPLERPFGWSQGWINQRSTTLVKVSTDDGLVGWGEGAAAGLIDGLLAPLLIGQDPMDRAGLWERMFHALYNGNNAVGLAGSALSALDIALWDLAGKATGLPVCALLGGKVRNKIAVYATGLYYTEGEFPDRLLDEARGYVAAGFKGMKTKVGGLSIAEDVARVRALREAIGPDIHLMVDANEAYNATTAIRLGQKLAELDLVWFEEPVNAQDLDAYLEVKAALPMAIAGGENLRTSLRIQALSDAPRLRHCPARHHALRRHHRNAAHLRHGQRLWHSDQPPRLGIARYDRRHFAPCRHLAALPASAQRPALYAGAGDGIRPHAECHPSRTMRGAV